MTKNAKPKINAETAYENAHLVVRNLAPRIGELPFDLPTIAKRHYLLTTDANFERATSVGSSSQKRCRFQCSRPKKLAAKQRPRRKNSKISKKNGTLQQCAACQNGEDRIRTCGPV